MSHTTNLELYRRAESALADMLKLCETTPAGQSPDISQEALDMVRVIFYAFRKKDGLQLSVPATLNVNLKTKKPTDLPLEGPYDFVRRVNVYDVLNAACLRDLDQQGEAGRIARIGVIDLILRTIRARIGATVYQAREQTLGTHRYRIHNDFGEVRARWTSKDLRGLFDKLNEIGLFSLATHDERLGLPLTSQTDTNPDMMRQWSVDSCMAGLIQRHSAPHLWTRNLVTNAAFHCTKANVRAMLRTIANPAWFRDGDIQAGLDHIFLPTSKNSDEEGIKWDEELQAPIVDSILPDPCWFNRKRLESPANVLRWACLTVIRGAMLGEKHSHLAALGKPWGFHWIKNGAEFPPDNLPLSERQKELVITGIQVKAMFLLAVQWNGEAYDFLAPTSSAWEEAGLKGGCASDTAFMVDAAIDLRDLLFNPDYDGNETIQDVRARLSSIVISDPELGNAAEILQSSPFADFRKRENLDAFIAAGRRKIGEMVTSGVVEAVDGLSRPIPSNIAQFPTRKYDTSHAILASEYSSFDPYPVRDARVRIHLVANCEANLMDARREDRYGMKRYGTFKSGEHDLMDSYLMLDFDLGITIPGLVVPTFARMVEDEYKCVGPYYEEREAQGSLSPRDRILRRAYERFVSKASEELTVDPRKDATDEAGMLDRQQFSLPDLVAQWSLGPTAALRALAKAKYALVSHLRTNDYDLDRARALLDEANKAISRMVNWLVTMIVQRVDANGNVVIRADGTPLPNEYELMEAWQAVLTVDGVPVFAPGHHPLYWAKAEAYRGLLDLIEAASLEESLPS